MTSDSASNVKDYFQNPMLTPFPKTQSSTETSYNYKKNSVQTANPSHPAWLEAPKDISD